MNKRGQFYIIIAVVLIAVISGLLVTNNYITTSNKPVRFYDLSEELGIESEKVITYGIYNEKDTDALIENFTDTYSDYFDATSGTGEKIFIYGNNLNMSAIVYTNVTKGRVSLVGLGDTFPFVDIEGKNKQKYAFSPKDLLGPNGEYVVVNLTGKEYQFTLNKGENFFFVISKKIQNETYVTRN